MAVIYRITNMSNGNYYIGSAESFARREWQHKYDLKRGAHKNPRLQAAWNKYGAEMFVFEIIEEIPEGRATFDVENTYLMKCVGQPDCYNINVDAYVPRLGIPHTQASKLKMSISVNKAIADGRGGKFIPSEETKAKMSSSAKGNQNALGHKRTDAEKEAIRQRALGNQNFLGKTHTEETKQKLRRPIYALLPNGTRRDFIGVYEAGVELETPYPMLVRICKTNKPVTRGKFSGWQFFYADADAKPVVIPDEYKHLPRSRSEAKATGAKQYFTGIPCDRGHISLRATKGTCIACRREDEKQLRHKE